MRGSLLKGPLRLPLAVLFLLHAAAAAAGLLAPYGPAEQDRARTLSPPQTLAFGAGGLVVRPGRGEAGGAAAPLRFFVRRQQEGGRRSFHLFGVEEPAAVHLLGTDSLGRDVLSRLLHGARASLFSGLLAAALAVFLAALVGAAAGAAKGTPDALLMGGAELVQALPWFYLLLAVRSFLPLDLGAAESFFLVTVLIGLLAWPAPARQVRGVVSAARESEMALAARASGLPPRRVLLGHLLPQAWPLLLTQWSLLVPRAIVAEVSLSFLGLGIGGPAASWGGILAELRSVPVLVQGWWMFAPAVALAIVVVSYHQVSRALLERASSSTDLPPVELRG